MTSTGMLATGLVARTVPTSDPGDLLDHRGPGGFALLDRDAGLVTSGIAARIRVRSGTEPGAVSDAAAAVLAGIQVDDELGLPGTGPVAVGALPFRSGGPAELVVPAAVVGRASDGTAWRTELTPVREPAPCRSSLGAAPSRFTVQAARAKQAWIAAVQTALEAIRAGEVEKVVLAREVLVDADSTFDPDAILRHLREQHSSCYVFAAGSMLGASPELLVRRRAHHVESRPVAGTAARAQVRELAGSAKDAAEHDLVVGAVAEVLRPLCATLDVPAVPEPVQLANVSHLASVVRGTLADPAPSALDLVEQLHPTPAVGGVPRDPALRLIAALEHLDRGSYAGPVGWVDRRGDGDWAVALRCAELDGCRARLVAGAGIVAASEPEAEWRETQRKLEAMLGALVRP